MRKQFELFLSHIQSSQNSANRNIKHNASQMFHEFTYRDPPPKMIAVDGSNRWIWYNPDLDVRIAVIRTAVVVYDYDTASDMLVLDEHQFHDKAFLIAPNNPDLLNFDQDYRILHQEISRTLGGRQRSLGILNQLRNIEEFYAATQAAEKFSDAIVAMDGALTYVQVDEIKKAAEELLTTCKNQNHVLTGISKRSTARKFANPLTDEAVVRELVKDDPRMVYTRIEEVPEKKQVYPTLGKVFLAKLHEEPIKVFRVDIAITGKQRLDDIFSHLAYYSKVDSIPGYPFPLVDAHNIATL
ncbi:MAG: DNA double-strand break repair nuclease NurA, partial [Candidatus Heimdallarchaeota archaeon]